MKPDPSFPCPLCHKKYFTREQSMTCAEADIKEAMNKKRKLKLVIKHP
jgi:hypothetical protein